MSTYSAGYLNVGTLNATGVSAQLKTSTATVTNLTATNVNTTNINGITNLNLSGNIANSGNQLSGVYALQASDIAKIEEVGAAQVSTPSLAVPNFFVSYGNASNSTINTKVYGTQSNGTPVPANPYIRIASETKVVATMTAAKLLEDGYFTLDSTVDSFLGNAADAIYDMSGNRLTRPWLIQNKSWMDNSGNFFPGAVYVPNILPPRVYNAGNPDCAYFNYTATGALISGSTLDASGATTVTTLNIATRYGYGPIVNFYNALNGTAYGPSNPLTGAINPVQMTVRHLVSMTCGLDYDFWTLGNFNGALPVVKSFKEATRIKLFGFNSLAGVITSGQLGPVTNSTVPTPVPQTSFNLDNSVGLLSQVPLGSFPGTFCEYSTAYDVLGVFMDQVVKQTPALLSTYGDIFGYAKQTILQPIGVNDFWGSAGQSQCPADASSNMMSASEFRATFYGGILTQWGASASYGYGFDGSYNTLKWNDQMPGASTTAITNTSYYQPFNSNLKHVGYLGGGCAMSVNSYGKVLQLFINKGWDINTNRRIVTKASINYLNMPTYPLSTQMAFVGDIVSQSAALGTFDVQPFVWAMGLAKVPDVWSQTQSNFQNSALAQNVQVISPSYPWAPGCLYWSGSYNTFYYINMETGNWMHFGTQQLTWVNKTSYTGPTSSQALALIRSVEGAISV